MKKLTLWPLVAATFFMVSGGPYGLEELVQKSGYANALLAICFTPLLWSLPTALMVGELAAAIPEEGGYYAWVRRALGPFWGFQEAWLSLVASFFDMAIYPTLFVTYAARLWPKVGAGAPSLVLGAALILVCVLWNLRGARAVGGGAMLFGAILFAPFVAMCVAAPFLPHAPAPAAAPSSVSLGAGLLVAMWNFMGWDNASTIAAEVHAPQRTYPRALLVTVAIVAVSYAVPVLAAWHVGIAPATFTTGAWVAVGEHIGGRALGVAVVLGGAVCAVGMFNALLLSYSRVPLALAEHGLLPRIFARTAGAARVPVWSIVVAGAIYTLCLGLGFDRLILFDVLFYGLGLLLEFIALIVLRRKEPRLARPFRVPLGIGGLIMMSLPPMIFLGFAFTAARAETSALVAWVAAALVLAGPVAYGITLRFGSGKSWVGAGER